MAIDPALLDPNAPLIDSSSRLTRNGIAAAALAQRTSASTSAQDLHERAFGEKSQMDLSKLSLAQQSLLATKARDLQNTLFRRAQLERAVKQNSSAASAIEQLNNLDVNDPGFKKSVGAIVAAHPEALGSTTFNKFIDQRNADYLDFHKAQYARSAESINDPDVSAAYNMALTATGGDPRFAAIVANAAKVQKNKAMTLAVSPDLSPEDKASLLNPETGKFNFAVVDALGLKAAGVKNARDAADAQLKSASSLTTDLKNLGPASKEDDQATIDARYNIQQALKNKTFQGLPGATPTTNTVASSIDKYLGKTGNVPVAAPATTVTPPAGETPTASPAAAPPEPVVPAATPGPTPFVPPTPEAPAPAASAPGAEPTPIPPTPATPEATPPPVPPPKELGG
jgi:hypothetical protein